MKISQQEQKEWNVKSLKEALNIVKAEGLARALEVFTERYDAMMACRSRTKNLAEQMSYQEAKLTLAQIERSMGNFEEAYVQVALKHRIELIKLSKKLSVYE